MAVPRSRQEHDTPSFETLWHGPKGSGLTRHADDPVSGYDAILRGVGSHVTYVVKHAQPLRRVSVTPIVLPTVEEVVDEIDAYPFDGAREHPLRKRLRPALESGSKRVAPLLQNAFGSTSDVAIQEDLLLLVATLPIAPEWDSFVPLFQLGLKHDSLRVRGAAVRALERLAVEPGSALRARAFGLLGDHQEPEAWLRDYVRRVIA